ncbi:hypothetical protein H4Q26_006538 [Puccinia striiformis f. sp. tritici PST-130]|uniref:Uncharacterized protein n=1 Tax=Puccinia striiformis f. sp. tritici PST-78 TaxID=1165861 RepID=A0A0L0V756_9BASI|nr:hypothetical protein H4Q26_006538 [Puccinia striiformis f. sp. tritici PST-130]KNE95107.1 hypothetical protein PSTG_11584 [Puccinia striiformis f. sp. tritici PST-78]
MKCSTDHLADQHIPSRFSVLIRIGNSYSLTEPPYFDLLSSKRPMYAFKFDGEDKRYRGLDNCAARNRLDSSESINVLPSYLNHVWYLTWQLANKDGYARRDP